MKLVFVIVSVLLHQALYLRHNLTFGRSSLKNSNVKGNLEEVLDLENIHFEKEVKVVKELDFEQKIEILGKHQNLREVVRMEMDEIAMKTQNIEMKDSREILEVKDMVRKSEKTKMEKEHLDVEESEMGTEQVLNDKDTLLKEEEDEEYEENKKDEEKEENEEEVLNEEEECNSWWCAICEAIHAFAIPVISICGLLGWCFSCFQVKTGLSCIYLHSTSIAFPSFGVLWVILSHGWHLWAVSFKSCDIWNRENSIMLMQLCRKL